jgi:hypothetical protein
MPSSKDCQMIAEANLDLLLVDEDVYRADEWDVD